MLTDNSEGRQAVDQDELRKSYQQAVLIAFGIISGSIFFGAVIYFLIANSPQNSQTSQWGILLRRIVLPINVLQLLASFYLKGKFLQKTESPVPTVALKGMTASISRLKTAMLVSMGICDGAVFFGIITAFFSGNPNDLLLPLIIGLIGVSAHFPRYSQWESWVNEQ